MAAYFAGENRVDLLNDAVGLNLRWLDVLDPRHAIVLSDAELCDVRVAIDHHRGPFDAWWECHDSRVLRFVPEPANRHMIRCIRPILKYPNNPSS